MPSTRFQGTQKRPSFKLQPTFMATDTDRAPATPSVPKCSTPSRRTRRCTLSRRSVKVRRRRLFDIQRPPHPAASSPDFQSGSACSSTGSNEMGYDWNSERTFELLSRLVNYLSNHGGKWPQMPVYDEWAIDFTTKFGEAITGPKLLNKKNRMRREFAAYKDMKNQTGLGYNPVTDTCICSNEAWREFVKRHSDSTKLRYNGLPHRDLYYTLFQAEVATGDFAFGPPATRGGTSSAPAHNMSIDLDEEGNDFLHDAYNVNASPVPECEPGSSGGTSHRRKRKQLSASEKVSAAICDIAKSMSHSSKSARMASDQDPWVVTTNHLIRLGLSGKDRNDVLMWFLDHDRLLPPFAFADDDEGRWDMIHRALQR